jgi:multidrug efflux pump subunit AcrA (membrane-fusion protein)
VEAARAGLSSAEARLQNMTTPESADVVAALAAQGAARTSVDAAELKLAELRASPLPADLAAARSAVDSAGANLRSAQAKLELLLAGPEAPDVRAQEQAVLQAEAALATRLAPSTPLEIEAQRQTVRSSEATLALKRNPYLPSDVASAQAALEQAETRLASAQKNLDAAVLAAPFAGVVSAVNVNVGEAPGGGRSARSTTGGTGGTASSSSAGATGDIILVDASQVRVDVQVDESDITRIAVGQRVTLSFDAFPNQRFNGAVAAVGPAGTASQGVVGYPVTIELRNPRGVRPGMTATAEIVYAQQENALMAPNRAVNRQGRDRTVQVITPSGTETRKVEVGMSNDQVTEVTAGLEEGDEVAMPTTTARAAVPGARAPGGPGGGFGGGAPGAFPARPPGR